MHVGERVVKGRQILIKHYARCPGCRVEGYRPRPFVLLLGMGHPFRGRLVVLDINTGLSIRHRHAVIIVLDCVRLETLDETLHVELFRRRLRADKAAHRQRRRGGRFGAVTAVRARDELGLPPEANFARCLVA